MIYSYLVKQNQATHLPNTRINPSARLAQDVPVIHSDHLHSHLPTAPKSYLFGKEREQERESSCVDHQS